MTLDDLITKIPQIRCSSVVYVRPAALLCITVLRQEMSMSIDSAPCIRHCCTFYRKKKRKKKEEGVWSCELNSYARQDPKDSRTRSASSTCFRNSRGHSS